MRGAKRRGNPESLETSDNYESVYYHSTQLSKVRYNKNMSELLHANVFFFIASMATVVFCILVSLVLYQVLKIMQSVRAIMDRIEMKSEQIADDIDAMRTFVQHGSIVSTIFNLFAGRKRRGRRTAKAKEDDSDESDE